MRVAKLVGTWFFLPVLLIAVVAFYVAIAVEHVNPPVIAVQGSSMRPALSNGDLALLQGVAPSALREGDVIVVAVPAPLQERDHLPPDIEHRIVGVTHTAHGVLFTTKGDANRRPDPFEVRPPEIVGKVTGSIPVVGYVFLFFGSIPGDVFLALLVLAAAGYLLARRRARRRRCLSRLAGTIAALREDADEIRAALANGWGSRPPAAAGTPPAAAAVTPTPAPLSATAPDGADAGMERRERSEELDQAASALRELAVEVRSTIDESRDSAAMLRDLVGAVSEYGVHLRSHTAVMRHLADTTDQLKEAATRLVDAVTHPATGLRPLVSDRPTDVPGSRSDPQEPPRTPRAPYARDPRRAVAYEETWREPFTSSELRWPNLARTAESYVAEPVDSLLDRAADALDLAERERDSLRDRLLVVENRLAILAEQRETDAKNRLDAQRAAQEVDARARHDATVALQDASRRAADVFREVEEERMKVLGIVRALSEQLSPGGNRVVGDAEISVTPEPPSAGPAREPSPSTPPSDAPPPAPPVPWTPSMPSRSSAPSSASAATTTSSSAAASRPASESAGAGATSDQMSLTREQGDDIDRREPPDVPPVWEVTPPPTR